MKLPPFLNVSRTSQAVSGEGGEKVKQEKLFGLTEKEQSAWNTTINCPSVTSQGDYLEAILIISKAMRRICGEYKNLHDYNEMLKKDIRNLRIP